MPNPDRPRGILTPTDRRYLLGEDDRDGQDERNTRYRIRERTQNSLLDLQLIADEMEPRDMERVLSDVDDDVLESVTAFLDRLGEYIEKRQELAALEAELTES